MGKDGRSSRKKKLKKEKRSRKLSECSDDNDLTNETNHNKESNVVDVIKDEADENSRGTKKVTGKKNKRSRGDENVDGDGDGENVVQEETQKSSKKIKKDGTDGDKPNFFAKNQEGSGSAMFKDLPLSEKTQTALAALDFTRMTQIQAKAIPSALAGKDVVGAAKTGSGKTLSFLIPAIELLHKTKFTTRNGTGAIVISPTRELAMQIFGVCQEIMTAGKHSQTFGLIMGGANRRTEADKLAKGINIVICTPGRLLDHLQNTKGFVYRNLLTFVMDEADRILEQGFEDDLRAILKMLPKERQTMLFSATQTKKVDDLMRVSIDPKNSIVADVPSETGTATVSGLEQGFVTCESDMRFRLLFTFLKKNKRKKIMVFFSSCNSVKFHAELLNYIDIPVMDIHGRQKQVKRTTTFFSFCKQKTGTLLCTDVAARGLDIPAVDWILQFDPPDDPKEYVHRVGRTARGATGSGRALLFLTPQETGFLKYLKAANVALNEYEFPEKKVANVQSQLQRLIETNYYLNRAARDAYRSYLLAYTSHSHRDIFNVHELDLQAVGLAFGFTSPPRVDLALGKDKRKKKRMEGKKKRMGRSTGHAFSADNPYGKRSSSDKRQFSH